MKPLIIDNCLNTGMAQRLGSEVDVAYFSSWQNAFPVSRERSAGTGLKGVERIDDPLTFMLEGKASHVIVPDLYLGGYENVARQLELPVFGSGEGQRLETDREFLLDFLSEHDLPVPESAVIEGITALGKYLKDKKDLYVKVSTYRGDHETEHHVDWDHSQAEWFDKLKLKLGPNGERIKFIVQEPIESVCEVGIDGYFLGRDFADDLLIGWEVKDAGYVGHIGEHLDYEFAAVLDASMKYFQTTTYNNFFSNEMRITKEGTVYMTDATCRVPSPPGGVMMAACRNFPDVVLKGASPDYGKAQWFCEIVLKSGTVRKEFLRVDYPKDMHYGFHNHMMIDGHTWIIPHDSEYEEFGSALGWGTSLDEAAEMANEAAKALKGKGVRYDDHVLEKAEAEIEKGKSVGIC